MNQIVSRPVQGLSMVEYLIAVALIIVLLLWVGKGFMFNVQNAHNEHLNQIDFTNAQPLLNLAPP